MTNDWKKHLRDTTAISRPGSALSAKLHRGTQSNSPSSPGAGIKKIALCAPLLGKNERGLVISVPSSFGETNTFWGGLDRQELRFSLLFWDRLDFPTGPFSFSDIEADYLAGVGVLTRSQIVATVFNVPDLLFEGQIATFKALDARDPNKWSLARGEASLGFRPEEVMPDRGMLLELYQAIPVPNIDVPLDDILQFKAKRAAELLTLRHHLDKLYHEVARSPERDYAKSVALEDIDRAVSDILKVSRESGMKLKLAGLDVKLDIMDFKTGAFSGLAAHHIGLPLSQVALAAIGGAIIPTLSIKSGVALKKREKSTSPFEYVSRFHRDLF